MRTYHIVDDGEELQVQMFEDHYQIAGALVDIESLGDDAAFVLARMLGETFKNCGGMGAQRPI